MINKSILYVGTYTKKEAHVDGKGKGIHVYLFDQENGQIEELGLIPGLTNPSYFAFNSSGNYLYVVNEHWFDLGPNGIISSFAVGKNTFKYTFLNQKSSEGLAPCYVSIDQTNSYVFVANYQSGTIASYKIRESGKLSAPYQVIQHSGSGFYEYQDETHAHSVLVDPRNKHLLAIDKGADKIYIYKLNQTNGHLSPGLYHFFNTDPGDGPRHLYFHPKKEYVYIINELSSSFLVFRLDYENENLNLELLQKVSTLPNDYTGENSCADIQVHPSGNFLIGSNRGHDSVVVYEIERQTGKIFNPKFYSSRGKTPRGFTLDQSGQFLIIANQDSNNMVVYRFNCEMGTLKFLHEKKGVPTPVCLKFPPRKEGR